MAIRFGVRIAFVSDCIAGSIDSPDTERIKNSNRDYSLRHADKLDSVARSSDIWMVGNQICRLLLVVRRNSISVFPRAKLSRVG
jgi:hypothetical protein